MVAVGSRHFGHPAISSLIRVKIYDFAMYMDGKQVNSFSELTLLILQHTLTK